MIDKETIRTICAACSLCVQAITCYIAVHSLMYMHSVVGMIR